MGYLGCRASLAQTGGRFDGDEARVDQPVEHGGGRAAKRREDKHLHPRRDGARVGQMLTAAWGCTRMGHAAQPWSHSSRGCSQEVTDA